jgi:transcription antitermination factor NusG
MPGERKDWYALRTRSRHEKRVWAQLEGRAIEVFLPLIARRSRWKDRTVQVHWPLFPGYCFARFSWLDRLRVLTAQGVVEVLGANGRAIPVPDVEIEAVRRLVTSTLPVDPHPALEPGMAVEIRRGPLQGIRGTLIRKAGKARLVVSVNLIRQGASVQIDADDAVPV